MPLPAAPENQMVVNQTINMLDKGVKSNGTQQLAFCKVKKNAIPCSVARANNTTTNPAVEAAVQTINLPLQVSKSANFADLIANKTFLIDGIYPNLKSNQK